MGQKSILAYKLGSQFDGKMSSESVFDAHFFHKGTNKVLFTTETSIVEPIDQLILISIHGNKGLIADVERFDTYEEAQEKGFELPSQWDSELDLTSHEQSKYTKFGLYNIKTLNNLSYLDKYIVSSNREPLLESFTKNQNPIRYIEEK